MVNGDINELAVPVTNFLYAELLGITQTPYLDVGLFQEQFSQLMCSHSHAVKLLQYDPYTLISIPYAPMACMRCSGQRVFTVLSQV